MKTNEPTFTIGQLAEKTGLTRRALRLYEQASVLVPLRDANNYRRYTTQHLKEAEVIRDLRAGGVSVQRIAQIIAIKRAYMPTVQKLKRYLHILDAMHAELLAKRQMIDDALAQLEIYQQDAITMLDALEEQTEEEV